MVVNATQELQMGVDWAANVSISDRIAQDAKTIPAVITSLRARLSHKSTHVQLLALRLLESCVKNSQDLAFPRAVATKEIMAALSALASGKKPRGRGGLFGIRCANSNLSNDMEDARREEQEVQELACILIRSWAEGFTAVENSVPLFSATYLELLKKGMGFPDLRSEEKITFRPRSPAQEEAEAITTRVRLLRDLIAAAGSSTGEQDMVGELVSELEITHEGLQRQIPGLDSEQEEALTLYLSALDEVEAVLQEYWELQCNHAQSCSTAHGEEAVELEPQDSELAQYEPAQTMSQVGALDSACGDAGVRPVAEPLTPGASSDLAELLGLNSPVAQHVQLAG